MHSRKARRKVRLSRAFPLILLTVVVILSVLSSFYLGGIGFILARSGTFWCPSSKGLVPPNYEPHYRNSDLENLEEIPSPKAFSKLFVKGSIPPRWIDLLKHSNGWKVVKQYNGVRGAEVYSHSRSFACFLLLRDVCNIASSQSFPGAWYSLRGQDLTRLDTDGDLCSHRRKKIPPGFTSQDFPTVSRIHKKMGIFIQRKNNAEEAPNGTVLTFESGFMSPHDPYLGHFMERVGSVAEITEAVRTTLKMNGSDFTNQTLVFGTGFFDSRGNPSPSEWSTEEMFPKNLPKILFGPNTSVVGTLKRPEGLELCFRRVIFPLNVMYQRKSIKGFRERLNSVYNIPNSFQQYQITLLWRSKRRKAVNPGDLIDSLRAHFPSLPITLLEPSSADRFEDVVATMRRTAFLIGIHGSAFANMIFLPSGAHVMEIRPFLFDYYPFRDLCLAYGLQYFEWQNNNVKSHISDNGCFRPEWSRFSGGDCFRNFTCRQCVRVHSLVNLNMTEISEVLKKVAEGVSSWLLRRSSSL